jgi:hypothetical protein
VRFPFSCLFKRLAHSWAPFSGTPDTGSQAIEAGARGPERSGWILPHGIRGPGNTGHGIVRGPVAECAALEGCTHSSHVGNHIYGSRIAAAHRVIMRVAIVALARVVLRIARIVRGKRKSGKVGDFAGWQLMHRGDSQISINRSPCLCSAARRRRAPLGRGWVRAVAHEDARSQVFGDHLYAVVLYHAGVEMRRRGRDAREELLQEHGIGQLTLAHQRRGASAYAPASLTLTAIRR